MPLFQSKYNPVKLKTNLKVAIKRLQLLQKKNDNASILARKEIAELLKQNREEIAKIKVEQSIRDDYYRDALGILETYCSLCLARFGLIETVQHCEVGVRKAVCTILWSTPRVAVDVTEFREISRQFTLRYGKEFHDACMADEGTDVCERVRAKLTFVMPNENLVWNYLEHIAKKYDAPLPERPEPQIIDTPIPQTMHMDVLTPKQQQHLNSVRAQEEMLSGLDFPSPLGMPQQQQQQPQYPPQPADEAMFAHPPSISSTTTTNNYPPQKPQNYPPEKPQNYPPSQPPPSYHSQVRPGEQSFDPFVQANLPNPDAQNDPLRDISQLPAPPGVDINQADSLDFDELSRRFDALHKQTRSIVV